jgi:hypothetical protein
MILTHTLNALYSDVNTLNALYRDLNTLNALYSDLNTHTEHPLQWC